MKIPANYDKQIIILKNLWFIINDEIYAKKYLKHIWFFRLSHYFNYLLKYQNWEKNSFDDILKCYIFDRKLKLIFSDIIERIEVSVKANIIDTLSLKYNNSVFFLNEEIYINNEAYNKLKNSFESEKNKNKSLKNIELSNCDSWKLFQWLTLWTTTFFYKSLNTQNQKIIANCYNFKNKTLFSWL